MAPLSLGLEKTLWHVIDETIWSQKSVQPWTALRDLELAVGLRQP